MIDSMTLRSASFSLLAGLLLAVITLTGCQELLVENEEDPDVTDVLGNPQDAQTLISSTWSDYFFRTQDYYTVFEELPMLADEGTSGAPRYEGAAEVPRVAYPNDYSLGSRFVSQNPWYEWYSIAENSAAAINAIENDGLQIIIADEGEEEATNKNSRARAFAYFTRGIAYGYIANIWDKASVLAVDADRDADASYEYRPYTEVIEEAMNSFDRAIRVSQNGDRFVVPGIWMGGNTVDNDGLARLARTYAARAMVYNARTPQERQNLDWERVLSYLEAGVIEQDIMPQLAADGLQFDWGYFAQVDFNSTAHKADYRLLGPGDVSGNYASWVQASTTDKRPFLIYTPDRRITGADDSGSPDPESDGKYFSYRPDRYNSATPPYLEGFYQWYRVNGNYRSGTKPLITVAEMDLIHAEALLRGRGDRAGAAQYINNSRVANGELEPVTESGVPGGLDRCVPRTMDGQGCGSLLAAIHYERMIEAGWTDSYRAWFDRRGFGTLEEGTYYHLPIPVRELQAYGRDFYTFGGVGNPGSADGNPLVE